MVFARRLTISGRPFLYGHKLTRASYLPSMLLKVDASGVARLTNVKEGHSLDNANREQNRSGNAAFLRDSSEAKGVPSLCREIFRFVVEQLRRAGNRPESWDSYQQPAVIHDQEEASNLLWSCVREAEAPCERSRAVSLSFVSIDAVSNE
jgi:hypothetical protein